MGLNDVLVKKKAVIVRDWFDKVVDTYPSDTSRFLKSQKDPFANPVGNTTLRGLEGMFDEILAGMDHAAVLSFLDPIIRIRAVQSFSASHATGFIFFLKEIIRNIAEKEIHENLAEWLKLDSRIETLALLSFDIYMGCREKIYDIKANEEKNRMFGVLERAGLLKEF